MLLREIYDSEIDDCSISFCAIINETKHFAAQLYKNSQENQFLFIDVLNNSIKLGIRPFVLELNGKVVAWNLVCDLGGFEYVEPTTFCFGTYVLQEYRGKGYATILTKYSFNQLKKKGIKRTLGQVFSERYSSNKFINDLGFIQIPGICKIL